MRLLLVAAVGFVPMLSAAAPCVGESGAHTAALVELYTAEDCRSCGPADRWLEDLRGRYPAERLVALALHVDSRDYLGSQKRDAQYRVRKRQGTLSLLQRMALVYTPHVLLQGHELPGWESGDFNSALARINAQPARAHVRLEMRSVQANGLAVAVQVDIVDPEQRRDAAIYVAASRKPPARSPVVLDWQGPLSPGADGRFAGERRLPLVPGATPGSSGVAAFVQNRRTAEVLQAVLLAACSP